MDKDSELEQCREENARLRRELERLNYAVSHDLRAPLRAVQGFSRLLLQKYDGTLDATAQDYLQRIVRASGRMGEQIEAMLRLSRIGRMELSCAAVGLADIAEEGLRRVAKGPLPTIQWQLAHLPAVPADPELLQELFERLLDNALKFGGCDQRACRIGIVGELYPDRVEVTVRDDGVGFDMQYADKLFTPFQRLHGEEEFPGLGSGLAIAARIAQRHGGDIRVEAAPGEGAAFTVCLPLQIQEST